jgi:hypothetical protein
MIKIFKLNEWEDERRIVLFIFCHQKNEPKKCPALWNATMWPSEGSEDSTGPAENTVNAQLCTRIRCASCTHRVE